MAYISAKTITLNANVKPRFLLTLRLSASSPFTIRALRVMQTFSWKPSMEKLVKGTKYSSGRQ